MEKLFFLQARTIDFKFGRSISTGNWEGNQIVSRALGEVNTYRS
jgi:hypothetical protein